ncbi:PIG-L deacetylase family protein [Kytococcus aerolatus]|uniref:PIG-L deacetylase family protein n=1 Tax=Kytococcus aerolatus TaxID=592308 RepID=UPI001F47ED3C|nr:PIG-L family deacetylase [Kytococcus aerolatus]
MTPTSAPLTVVFLHAHPDDEASQTAGTMRMLADAGHRVVVVYATNGDHGFCPDDLAPGETLVDRRRSEAEASARVTGTQAVHWLGYADSGMTGWEQNGAETSFHGADTLEAARALAGVLDAEGADVLVTYDWHGGYGHPDHIKAHRVAHAAVELAARRPRLLEASMNRDAVRRAFEEARAAGMPGMDPDAPMDDGNPLGTPEAELHWHVDVRPVLDVKRRALECHASQVSDVGMMLALPEEAFGAWLGHEHYAEPGRAPGMVSAPWWE